MKIGYARTASTSGNIKEQVAALKAAGCARIFTDEGVSGLKVNHAGLTQALAAVNTGDTLVVQDMTRLARDIHLVRRLLDTLKSRSVTLENLSEQHEALASHNEPPLTLRLSPTLI